MPYNPDAFMVACEKCDEWYASGPLLLTALRTRPSGLQRNGGFAFPSESLRPEKKGGPGSVGIECVLGRGRGATKQKHVVMNVSLSVGSKCTASCLLFAVYNTCACHVHGQPTLDQAGHEVLALRQRQVGSKPSFESCHMALTLQPPICKNCKNLA